MIPYGKRLIELRGEKSQEEAARDIRIAFLLLNVTKKDKNNLDIQKEVR